MEDNIVVISFSVNSLMDAHERWEGGGLTEATVKVAWPVCLQIGKVVFHLRAW